MARFNSTITNYGSQVLTNLVVLGEALTLTRAVAGDGRPTGSPAEMTALMAPRLDIQTSIGEKTIVEGSPTLVRLPVQVSNKGLTARSYIREVGIYAMDGNTEFLFAYCWIEGSDGDNILDVSGLPGEADTIHIQDVGLFVTNQEAGSVVVQMGGGTYVSQSELYIYAAEKEHKHAAGEIIESTGESVEVAQRRQDYDIAAMKEQLDTGFVGTSVTHTVAANELENWSGYDGTGYPEGIYDESLARFYA